MSHHIRTLHVQDSVIGHSLYGVMSLGFGFTVWAVNAADLTPIVQPVCALLATAIAAAVPLSANWLKNNQGQREHDDALRNLKAENDRLKNEAEQRRMFPGQKP